jgi:5-methylcytosine-specific restriction endonuclease McrA
MRRPCLGLPGRPCGALSAASRCRPCHLAYQRARTAARPAWERAVYGSRGYKRLRRTVLEEEGWTCHWCGGPATTADHTIPVRVRPDLGAERSNLVAACRSCQEKRKVRR